MTRPYPVRYGSRATSGIRLQAVPTSRVVGERTYRIKNGSARHPQTIPVLRGLVALVALLWLLALCVAAAVAVWVVIGIFL